MKRPAEIITGFVAAVLGVLVAFGIEVTEQQVMAILTLVGLTPAVVTLVVEALRRRNR